MAETDLVAWILIGYLILVGILGAWAARRMKSDEGFFVADRKVDWPVLSASLGATVLGGSATIAVGALIYQVGLPGMWLDIGGIVGLLVLGVFLAGIVRKTGKYTLPEIVGHLFDDRVRRVAAVLVVISEIAWVALLLQACGAVVSVLFSWDMGVVLAVIAFLFIAYTFLGGQFSVVYTDVIQMIVMIIGVCVIAMPLIVSQAWPLFGSLDAEMLSFPVNQNVSVVSLVSMFFMMCMPHIVGPDIYSKILSARDEKAAKYATLMATFLKGLFAASIALIALSAIVLFPDLSSPSLAVPQVMLTVSPLLAGIVLAGLISTMISSADSILLSAGSVLAVDVCKRKDRWISRLGIVLAGVLGYVLAVSLNSILDTLTLAYTVFTAGLTLPVLCGFYKKKTKVTSLGAFIALISGGGISLLWLWLDSPYIDAVLVGMVCSLIPLVVFRGDRWQ